MTTRKKSTAPVVLTPEQVEARARRNAYVAAREDLVCRALALAEKLHPGRVHPYRSVGEGFAVMFGPEPLFTFHGPGLVELQVELAIEGSDDFEPPSLRFAPRSFSLESGASMVYCEAVGRALIDAAALARTLTLLTA